MGERITMKVSHMSVSALAARPSRLRRNRRALHSQKTARRPRLEALENRALLSVVNLTTVGSSGTISGAIFRQGLTQPAGSGTLESFVRIDRAGTEFGYDTDARPYVDRVLRDGGTSTNPLFSHALPLDDVPIVSIGGQAYLQFSLEVNQQSFNPLLSLDEVQVSLSSSSRLQGYTPDGTYGGRATLVYDMGGNNNTFVKLNGNLPSGIGGSDMYLDVPLAKIPDTAFSGANRALPFKSDVFVYLYSHFGTQKLNGCGCGSANDGFEEWAVPAHGDKSSTTATTVYNAGTNRPIVNPVAAGISVKDSATVTGSKANKVPSGNVTFLFYHTINGTGPAIGAGTVVLNSSGVANYSSVQGPLPAGAYSFRAFYTGDKNYRRSESPAEPISVQAQPIQTTTQTTIAQANNLPVTGPVALGTSVYDTAVVTNQTPGVPATGTVTYEFFNTPNGTGPHTDQIVNLNPNGTVPSSSLHGPLAAGGYSFIAVYSGDRNYLGSTSAVEPLVVQPASSTINTAIALSSLRSVPVPFEVPLGSTVTDTSTIAGQVAAIPATGTVTYKFFTTLNGTGPSTNEVVNVNPNGTVPDSALHGPLAAGSFSFVAVYSGDSNYAGSTSPVEPLVVQQGTTSSSTVIVNSNQQPVTAPVPLGTTVQDTATVSGQVTGLPATGTVTYEFFTTSNGTGPHTDEIVNLNPDGTVPNSAVHGPLAAGAYSFVATYSGDSNYFGSTSPVEPLSVEQGTAISATVIQNAGGMPVTSPVPLGTTIQDTATISGQLTGLPATGTVTYEFFATIDGTGPHTDEVVTLNPNGTVPNSSLHGPLAAGSHSFIAIYSGDSNYAGSTSTVEPLTVSPATPTAATVIVDADQLPVTSPVPLGTMVQDTATISGQVAGLPASGTVTYEFFSTIDGTGPQTDEVVDLNPDGTVPDSALTAALAAGSYSYIAVYSGDSNYAGATSAVEPLTVQQGTTLAATAITDSNHVVIPYPYNVPLGTSVYDTSTIAGQVAGLPASGTVTYEFYSTIDGTGPNTDEVVNLNPDGTVPDSALNGPLAAGAYSFVAVYSGDGNYLGSTSEVEPLTVGPNTSAIVTSIATGSGVTVPVPFEVPLASTVMDTSTITGQAPGVPATGTVTYEFFHTVDGTGPSTDEMVDVNPDGTVPDSALTFPLAAGAYSYVAIYSGDMNYAGSTSPVEPLVVLQGTSSSSTVIVNSSQQRVTSPVPLGTTVGDTATVAGSSPSFTPTGTLTYEFFTTMDGTGPHTDEVVTLNPDGTVPSSSLHGPLAAGAYSFVAVYSGDNNYIGSESPVEPLTVAQATPTAATVIENAGGMPVTSPLTLGTTIQDTAMITGQVAGLPATGTLTYEFFTTINGTGPHTDEVVTLNPDGAVPNSSLHGPLGAGSYSFIAVYSGDSNYAGSTSAVEPLTVAPETPAAATVIVDADQLPVTSPVPLGSTVQDTATINGQVAGLPASGTVTYEFFSTIDGTGPHTDEVVNLNPDGTVPDSALTSALAAGSYSYVAVYSGDSNYAGVTSAVEPLIVAMQNSGTVTAINLSDSGPVPLPAEVNLGSTVFDTATIVEQVSGLPATGTVTYEFFTTIDGTGPHTDEVVNLNPDGTVPNSALHGPLAAGEYSFIAIYSGDSNYAGSASAVEPLTVELGEAPTTTVIVNNEGAPITAPVFLGTTVGDTATVTGSSPAFTPTGTVTYQFFSTPDATGPHTDEVVNLNPDGTVPNSALQGPLTAGEYSFVAVYSGDSNYVSWTSSVELFMVEQGTSTTGTVIMNTSFTTVTPTVQLAVTNHSGETVFDSASVVGVPAAFVPTGTVTYTFTGTKGTTLLGLPVPAGWTASADKLSWSDTVALSDGTVPDSAPLPGLLGGSYEFFAQYSGDANFQGSTSVSEPLTINGHGGAFIQPADKACRDVLNDFARQPGGHSKVTVRAALSNGTTVQSVAPSSFKYFVRFTAPGSSIQINVNQSQMSPLPLLAAVPGNVTLHNENARLLPIPSGAITFTPTDTIVNLSGLTRGSAYYLAVRYSTQVLVGQTWPFGANTTVYDYFQTSLSPGGLVPRSTVALPIQGVATGSTSSAVGGSRAARAGHAITPTTRHANPSRPSINIVKAPAAWTSAPSPAASSRSVLDRAIEALAGVNDKPGRSAQVHPQG